MCNTCTCCASLHHLHLSVTPSIPLSASRACAGEDYAFCPALSASISLSHFLSRPMLTSRVSKNGLHCGTSLDHSVSNGRIKYDMKPCCACARNKSKVQLDPCVTRPYGHQNWLQSAHSSHLRRRRRHIIAIHEGRRPASTAHGAASKQCTQRAALRGIDAMAGQRQHRWEAHILPQLNSLSPYRACVRCW
eukprot:SAG25_NODE_346_length_9382_cov_25.918669_5_plen_191_part_00